MLLMEKIKINILYRSEIGSRFIVSFLFYFWDVAQLQLYEC